MERKSKNEADFSAIIPVYNEQQIIYDRYNQSPIRRNRS